MVWAVVALVIVLAILLSRIKSVRNFYAVGDNREGAYLLGINVPLTEFTAYALAGLFAGAAAIVFTGQIGFVPMQTGSGQELKAIAAVVLGGVSLMGGTGSIWSAVIGALFLTTVELDDDLSESAGLVEQRGCRSRAACHRRGRLSDPTRCPQSATGRTIR